MDLGTKIATVEQAKLLGLSPQEFDLIIEALGRTPNFNELSIYSVMWSEHCSYKNSIVWLKKLPKKGSAILAEAGEENAGLVDIGYGLACAFKIESHNHPSAIEPYQGAATGVGGIHRDIFTMGARPIAALNALRFGPIDDPKAQRIIKGVVKGIGDYGNSFGVPTVAGDTYFDECYATNPLVNAMSVGVVEIGKTISAAAQGPGNLVLIVGAATGKDGIHGATFASGDLDENSASKLPSVQVGDPFMEKLLLEATLEAAEAGLIVSMQDMGAAGITCSTSEMSARNGLGMEIDLSKAPLRQADMKPFEILLSESQERMLVIIEPHNLDAITAVFDKWDLKCEIIGTLTDHDMLNYYFNGELVASTPAHPLVLGGGAPVYHREFVAPKYLNQIASFSIKEVPDISADELISSAHALLALPNIASRKWISRQYDGMVQTNSATAIEPAEVAIVRLKGTPAGIAMTVDCNPYYVYADPNIGTQIAVAEAARNIACTGARPLAVTNNLNFGNPHNPENYFQFVGAIEGMSKACLAFDTPVTGGNVSFYNQSADGGSVMPTPTIGMIGLLHNMDNLVPLGFQKPGHKIALVGPLVDDVHSSQYLRFIRNVKLSPPPYFDLDLEHRLQQFLQASAKEGLAASAHDLSEGGLFVSLFEACQVHQLGCQVVVKASMRLDSLWFGEGQGRVVLSFDPAQESAIHELATKWQLPIQTIGVVTTDAHLVLNDISFGDIKSLDANYQSTLPSHLG